MSRPKKEQDEKRIHRLSVRLTDTELDLIKGKAQVAGVALSEYQRRACLEGVVLVRESATDKAAIAALLSIGNNLNQLTRKAHIHDEVERGRLNDVLDLVVQTVRRLSDDI